MLMIFYMTVSIILEESFMTVFLFWFVSTLLQSAFQKLKRSNDNSSEMRTQIVFCNWL